MPATSSQGLQWCWGTNWVGSFGAGRLVLLWVLWLSFSIFWEGEECSHPVPGRLSWTSWSCWKEQQCKEFCFASSHFSAQRGPEVGRGSWEDQGGGFTTRVWLGSEAAEGWPRNPARAFEEGLVESTWPQFCSIVSVTFPSLTTLLEDLENRNYAVRERWGKERSAWMSECVCVCVSVCVSLCVQGVLRGNDLLQGGFHFWPNKRCGKASLESMQGDWGKFWMETTVNNSIWPTCGFPWGWFSVAWWPPPVTQRAALTPLIFAEARPEVRCRGIT